MTLEYWREYRTQFHIGVSWGLDETNVLRNIRKVENILIKSARRVPRPAGLFNVEGKKKVRELDSDIEVLVVDVTEHEVERPKKSGCIRLWRGKALRAEVSSACVAPSNRKDITAANKNVIL